MGLEFTAPMRAKAKSRGEGHDCTVNLAFNRRGNTEETERTFPSEDGHTAHCVVCWKGYY